MEKNKQINEQVDKDGPVLIRGKSGPFKSPKQVKLDEVTKLRLENYQLKINLHNDAINKLYSDMKLILSEVSRSFGIDISKYRVDFENGMLYLIEDDSSSRVERGI